MATSKSNSTVTSLDDETPDTVAQAAAEPGAVEVKGANHDVALSGGKVLLTIHSSNEDGGQEAVKVGVNGYMYLVPRNKPCQVPAEVAEVIRNAVVDQIKLSSDGKGHITHQAPRYAYSISPV